MRLFIVLLLAALIFAIVGGCTIPVNETKPKIAEKLEEPNKTVEIGCCVGCGENECEKLECPFECCEELVYQRKDCLIGNCVNNVCIAPKKEEVEKKPTTIVYTIPGEVKAGTFMEIILLAGDDGASEKITFYDSGGSRVGVYSIRCGTGSYNCFTKIRQSYKTSPSWKPGEYYLKVLDLGANKYVQAYFNITE